MQQPIHMPYAAHRRRVQAIASDFICSYYRLVIPIRSMVEQSLAEGDVYYPFFAPGSNVNAFPNGILLVQRERNLGPDAYAHVRSLNARIVHDLDDLLWDVPVDNAAHHAVTDQVKRDMFAGMRAADTVTVSTEPLRQALAEQGVASIVVPNLLYRNDWRNIEPRRAPRDKPRVGWYGQSAVHVSDINWLDFVVRALADEVQWVFFGDLSQSLADIIHKIEFHPSVSLPLFPAMLGFLDLDLLLSPLAMNRFNEAKSNLRILQAGAIGYPVVATDIGAHRGMPVSLVPNDPALWISVIRDRLSDLNRLRREGEALQAYVWEHFEIARWSGRIYEIWATGR